MRWGNTALFIGGPAHGELRALKSPGPTVEYYPLGLDWAVPYVTVVYKRRRQSVRATARAAGLHHDQPLAMQWDIYVAEGSEIHGDRYEDLVRLLLQLTGQLATGGASLWITADWFVDG